MKHLLLIIPAILLTGCGPVRVLNEGASGPWRVTVSNSKRVNADAHDRGYPAGLNAGAFCDPSEQEIRLPSDTPRDFAIAAAMHELGHKIEREYPRIWVELDAMDTPDFPCGSDDLHAARRAAKQATKDNK
jgi:hypothetical protein